MQLVVNLVCEVCINVLGWLMVINRDLQSDGLQARVSLRGVGVDHKERQRGGESACAQLKH